MSFEKAANCPCDYRHVGGAKGEVTLRVNSTHMFFRSSTDLSPSEFKAKLNETNGVVIDCRTAGECAGGTWPGAQKMDWLGGEVHQKVAQLDKSKSYFLYCRSGNRSAQATKFLKANGIENAYNIGGYGSIIDQA